MDIEAVTQAEAALAAGDPREAVRVLANTVSFATDLDEAAVRRVFGLLARAVVAAGADADAIAPVADRPDDPGALYDAGFALYELGLHGIAACALGRANRLAPGQPRIVAELLMCLEQQLQYGLGMLVAETSGLAGRDPFITYLGAFHALMAGDVDKATEREAQIDKHEPQVAEMRDNLRGMLARADALQRAGIALDAGALTAWQLVIDGTVLLHASPYGHPDPMHGRYAFVQDSPALMREGLMRLQAVLEARGVKPTRVVAAPDRASRILAQAAAWVLGARLVPWTPGAEVGALVVAWQLEGVGDDAFLRAMHARSPGQVLFVHLSNWVDPFPYAPDVTTALVQTATNPFTGGALRVDPATQTPVPSRPDARPDAALAAEILRGTDPDGASVTGVDHVCAVARAWTPPGDGRRLHQRAGSPVPSARFT